MTQSTDRTVFGGVTGTRAVPEWYGNPDEVQSLSTAVDAVSEHTVGSPNRSRMSAKAAFDPLVDLLRSIEIDGRSLRRRAFGELRTSSSTRRVTVDVLFEGVTVAHQGDPLAIGVSGRVERGSRPRLLIEGVAQDTSCRNSMRQLTERTEQTDGRLSVVRETWADELHALGTLDDDLGAAVATAHATTIETPTSVRAVYESIGLPARVATVAARRVAQAHDPSGEVDAWTLYSGATYALTHGPVRTDTDQFDAWVDAANALLVEPRATLDQADTGRADQFRIDHTIRDTIGDPSEW